MIKNLLFIFLFSTVYIAASAQCTPNISCVPANSAYGICPDTTTGLKHGVVNVPYSETISLKVPSTTDAFGVPGGTLNSIVINKVEGLEPNLTYQCAPANCTYPGNSTGCAIVTGTPTQVWDKPIIVKVTASVTMFGNTQSIPRDLTGYRCVVTAPTGIGQLSQAKFDVGQNVPNPFNGRSEIHFTLVNNENVDFKVYNLLGAVVYSSNFKGEKGMNTITIEANSFAPGVYVYSVSNPAQTITKRMIVSR